MKDAKDTDDASEITRRSFLDIVVKGGIFTWVTAMVAPAVTYLWPIRKEGPGSDFVRVGPVKEFPVGTSKMVQSSGKPILVIRLNENEYRAFSATCTHLGCVVQWGKERKQIICPCHAGLFDIDGKVIAGPPPRPLLQYPVNIIGDEVRVKLQAQS